VDLTSGVRPTRPGIESTPCPISSNTPRFGQASFPKNISDEMWDIITKCWAHNPLERPDMGLVESWIRLLHLQEGFAGHGSEEPRICSTDVRYGR
jgi:hypothetical protein